MISNAYLYPLLYPHRREASPISGQAAAHGAHCIQGSSENTQPRGLAEKNPPKPYKPTPLFIANIHCVANQQCVFDGNSARRLQRLSYKVRTTQAIRGGAEALRGSESQRVVYHIP